MKVKELVKLCNDICRLGIPQEFFDGENVSEKNGDAELIVQSCNNVLDELYCDYAIKEQKAEVLCVDGAIDVSKLSFNRVLSLKDGNGRKTPYRYAQGKLLVEKDGKYVLRYAETAQKYSLNDELVMPSPRITPRIFSYGVLREYYRIVGDYYNADVWDGLFYDALKVALVKTPYAAMPPVGRWA